jgi:hypothetical protein
MPVKTPPTNPVFFIEEAEALLIALGDIKAELAPLEKKEAEIKAELRKWSDKNRHFFAEAKSCQLKHGLLTYSTRTDLKVSKQFDVSQLKGYLHVLKPDATKVKEELLDNPKAFAKVMKAAGLELVEKESFTAKANT